MTVIETMAGSGKKPDLTRRRLLAAAVAGGLSYCLASGAVQAATRPKQRFRLLSAATRQDHVYTIGDIDASGRPGLSLATGMRCHGGALHPTDDRIAVMFARRPGTHLFVMDTAKGELATAVACPQERHFYGHGCFSSDGAYLYTTENDYQAGVGVIGVWDGSDFSRLGEMPSHGIGPHDMHLLPDGKTLIVANGGIRTHPDYLRRKLNLKTMASSLVYMAAANGDLLNRCTLENRFLSIRHLAVDGESNIGIALQYEGPEHDLVPLVAVQRGDGPIRAMEAEGCEATIRRMRQYTASICIHPHTGIAGVTCPRGNIVTFWRLAAGECVKTLAIDDAGGIALDSGNRHFLISTGTGKVIEVTPDNFSQRLLFADEALGWDNHLIGDLLLMGQRAAI